ncbi:unnamed protein product [Notodromas monacha]|uniref:Coiled-coil domain-containing protein n=1 Tax=Notodromas monacha TaxID=399045 RepID=A0A7R9GHX6_9CRUS|nr:unnamed protein product [Notodromas monacha]CAG0923363.1 unnamed protein product [Notodromas monacha]
MPKKFASENTKAAAARARKDAASNEEKQRRLKAEQDELWKDEDKLVARKQQRKEERERKKVEVSSKKAEVKALLEAETGTAAGGKDLSAAAKVTRAQIQAAQEREAARTAKAAAAGGGVSGRGATTAATDVTHLEVPLEENLNRLTLEEAGHTARSVDEAIVLLNAKDAASLESADRHPERRVRAAYAEFEALRLPILRAEQPNLRLSQLKQLLRKEWLCAPENPMNQRTLAYNAKPTATNS